jgi:dethiobiotin synthetase
VIIFLTGTGTEVGKTFVAAALARELRAHGLDVVARKPAQSFADGDISTDADVLGAATGEDPHAVCPPHRWLRVPMAPPMAADELGAPRFTIAELVSELSIPPGAITLVEGAGGVRSPLACDGDNADFATAVHPDHVLLVADAGLGTINLVRLSTASLSTHRVVVFLNRFDGENRLHQRNRAWLQDEDGMTVHTDVVALANDLLVFP